MAKCPTCNEDVFCPKCGSSNGALGTSYAYFICFDCRANGIGEQYWIDRTKATWKEAVLAAPHGKCGSGKQYFDSN